MKENKKFVFITVSPLSFMFYHSQHRCGIIQNYIFALKYFRKDCNGALMIRNIVLNTIHTNVSGPGGDVMATILNTVQ